MDAGTATAQVRRKLREVWRSVRSDNEVVANRLLNRGPRASYRRQPRTLSPVAERVAADLVRTGVATTSVSELMPDDSLWLALRSRAERLRSRDDLVVDPAKPFLTELMGSSPAVAPDDPLLALALHPQIRGVAEAYCGMHLRVQDLNIWVNTPVEGSPTQSQRWHRDLPEDFAIVKCFVYLSDVPDGAGPLQYAAGSNTAAGRKTRLRAEFDGIGHRISDEEVAAAFGDGVVIARGPAGTLVFADTRGVHRGGFASTQERVVAQITYASRASSRPRNLRPAPGTTAAELPDLCLVRS